MLARVVLALIIAITSIASYAKDEPKKLSDEDRKALAKVNFVIVMRKNDRATATGNADGKAAVKVADQNASFRVNIDAINSTYWTVQADPEGGQGVQVDRKQVLANIFGKDMTEELKAQIQRELKRMGIYPVSWGGNAAIDESVYAAEAQVLLRVDFELPVGAAYKQALQTKALHTIAEIPAAPLYEQIVLGAPAPVQAGSKVTITNNAKESVVGLLVYDKRDDKFNYLVNDRDDMIIRPEANIAFNFHADTCSSPTILMVVFADATYAEAAMSDVCTAGTFPDLKTAERFPITGQRTKKDLVTIFYSLNTLKFQKTEGKFDKHRLTGKGWTNFHGDVFVSEFKDGFRQGTGNFCAKGNGGTVNVQMNMYNNGLPENGYNIILEPNKVNKDPTNRFEPISFEKLYKKLCFWEY